MTLGLLDGPALAEALHIHPGTIRNWAHAGLLIRRGTNLDGRTLYDVDEAVTLANQRGAGVAAPEPITVTTQNDGTGLPPARRCGIIKHSDRPGRNECKHPAVPDAPFPICELHLRQAFLYVNDRLEELPFSLPGSPVQPKPDADRPPHPNAVVYYCRRDDYIKIGTTVHLRKRMRELGADLLATEPGDMRLERLRHKQFSQYQVVPHSEWHIAAPELLSHIAMIVRHNEAKSA